MIPSSDVDGKYSVSVKGGKTILVFSYIGYISQEIPVGNQKTLNVTMKEDTGRTGRSGCDRLRHGQEEGLDGGDLDR